MNCARLASAPCNTGAPHSTVGSDEQLYGEENVRKSMERISAINYHQELEHHGIKYSAYNAGHVLGAAMFLVEIAGVRVLYTGDFSRDEDRHLMSAELPPVSPNVVIVESTYGVQTHEPRDERELRFTNAVSEIVRRGGRCLIPVFALGRAQEVLLILDEYWEAHPELTSVPIYYASTLAQKCMKVYQTYVSMMNEHIRVQSQVSNPFRFKHVEYLKGIEHFDDIGPSVVMASPGMLQSGLSRDLFERWAPDRKNGVVITGYSVEGTLAKHIMSEPSEVTTTAGLTIPLNLSVTYVSFSAHSDFRQTSEFLDALMPPYVVLVHGDGNEMGRLRAELARRYESNKQNVQVLMPKNTQTVTLKFRADKMAKTVGQLAATPPVHGAPLSGVIVRKDFTHHLMTPADLHTYTQLSTTVISQRLSVAFQRPFAALLAALTQVHQQVEQEPGTLKLRVMGLVTVTYHTEGAGSVVTLEWVADPFHDMLADSIVALLLQLDATPANLRAPIVTAPVQDAAEKMLLALLTQAFGAGNAKPQPAPHAHVIEVSVDGVVAQVDTRAKSVTCEDGALAQRIKTLLGRTSLEDDWRAAGPEPPAQV